MKGDLDIIKAGLIDRIHDLCQRLLPNGREEGGLWVSFDPVEQDEKPGRLPALKIRVRGGDIGAWKNWRSGTVGDVIKLVAYLERTDVSGALTWSRDFLGLRAMTREDRENMRRVEAERREQRDDEAARHRARKLAAAQKLAMTGFSFKADRTFAHEAQKHAERYFAARQVPLAAIPTLNPHSFMFSPATEWWKGAVWRNDGNRRIKVSPGPDYPAVHASMRNALGNVTGCHVTFLDPLRAAKAPVDAAKLMFGEALGAVIEISMGPNNSPFWHDEGPAQPVVLAEGIETALSFAVAGVPARVWACGSLAGIGGAPVHLPCISWVMFARDNNDGNRTAQKQFSAVLEKLEASGKHIEVVASHVGDDFNDLAKGEE